MFKEEYVDYTEFGKQNQDGSGKPVVLMAQKPHFQGLLERGLTKTAQYNHIGLFLNRFLPFRAKPNLLSILEPPF